MPTIAPKTTFQQESKTHEIEQFENQEEQVWKEERVHGLWLSKF